MLVEMVKIIQSALVLWGMVEDGIVGDGLFCDETKKGIFAWRRAMGMEHEESMRMEVSELRRDGRRLMTGDRKRRVEGVSIQRR